MDSLPVDENVKEIAGELHRRRVLSGSTTSTLRVTVAEIAFLSKYNKKLDLDDLALQRRNLDLITEDVQGRRIRIITRPKFPMLVYARLLDVDVYAFLQLAQDKSRQIILSPGWLSVEQVEEAPVQWYMENEKRKDYSHSIEQPFLVHLPKAFDFNERCIHDDWGWYWHSREEGWECFGCDRLFYSAKHRESIRQYHARTGDSVAS